jgi:hypothetical protein
MAIEYVLTRLAQKSGRFYPRNQPAALSRHLKSKSPGDRQRDSRDECGLGRAKVENRGNTSSDRPNRPIGCRCNRELRDCGAVNATSTPTTTSTADQALRSGSKFKVQRARFKVARPFVRENRVMEVDEPLVLEGARPRAPSWAVRRLNRLASGGCLAIFISIGRNSILIWYGCPETAIAWTLEQPGCSHTLVGARNPELAMVNAKAGSVQLTKEEIRTIRKAVDQTKLAAG